MTDKRITLLTDLERAHWALDAPLIIQLLQSPDVQYLTVKDVQYIFTNILCRNVNDDFAKELYKWQWQTILSIFYKVCEISHTHSIKSKL
jgi:hypothetical protein